MTETDTPLYNLHMKLCQYKECKIFIQAPDPETAQKARAALQKALYPQNAAEDENEK